MTELHDSYYNCNTKVIQSNWMMYMNTETFKLIPNQFSKLWSLPECQWNVHWLYTMPWSFHFHRHRGDPWVHCNTRSIFLVKIKCDIISLTKNSYLRKYCFFSNKKCILFFLPLEKGLFWAWSLIFTTSNGVTRNTVVQLKILQFQKWRMFLPHKWSYCAYLKLTWG